MLMFPFLHSRTKGRKIVEFLVFILIGVHLILLGCSFEDIEYLPPIAEVAFVSVEEAWLVTKQGELIRLCADGTRTTATEIPSKVESVTFRSPDRGWAVDSARNIWMLNDNHWAIVGDNHTKWHALSVDFGDESVGWIRTLEPLFRTEDGGRTWKQILVTGPGELLGFFASGPDTAYLYGDNGSFRRTTNRGDTWESMDIGARSDIIAFDCREGRPEDCWAGTSEGGIFVIDQNGKHKRIRLPEKYEFGVTSICLIGQNRALVAGFTYVKPNNPASPYGILYETDDDGKTWRSIDVPDDNTFVKVTGFGDTIWLASNSSIYRSIDAGKTWARLMNLPDPLLEPQRPQ